MLRQHIVQHRPPDIHRVRALADNNGVARNRLLQMLEHRIVVQRRAHIARHLRHGRPIRGTLSAQRLPPVALVVELVVLAEQLLQQVLGERQQIGLHGHLAAHAVVHLLRAQIHLNHLHVGRVPRRPPKVQHPVQAGAQQQNDVGLLQRQRARRLHALLGVVGHHALAHRRRQERQIRLLHQLADGQLGACVGGALADDHQRPLGRLDQAHGVGQRIVIGVDERRRRVRVLVGLQDGLGHLGQQQIAGQIEVRAAGPAVRGQAHGLLDVQRNQGGVGRAGGVLAVRTGRLHLGVLLIDRVESNLSVNETPFKRF